MMDNAPSRGERTGRESKGDAFALLLFIDFFIVVVMLITDQNLQTDFGAQPKFYIHWYGALGLGIVDLVFAIAILGSGSSSARRRMSVSSRRRLVIAGVVWTVLTLLASVGIVETYAQVGFSSAAQFAQYLFGVTRYPGVLPYTPWLYDLMLAMGVFTVVIGSLAASCVRAVGADPVVD